MFRPTRILQAVLIALSTAGCATTTSQAPSTDTKPSSGAAFQTSAKKTGTVAIKALAEPASIQAGESRSGRTQFFKLNGELNDDIASYAQEVATVRKIPLDVVTDMLQQAQYNETAAKLMRPTKGRIKRSWVTYKKRNVDPARIQGGVQFWQKHRLALDQISKDYGVPPSIIVAILGVETVYGKIMGDFKVLDALFTLGFAYPDDSRPERGQLFRDQLADLIELHYQGELDARIVQGSFAGAMGMSQFMPGSLIRYAVDGDGDGRIDLRNNPADAMASIANFLRAHGWEPGLPVFAPVELSNTSKAMVDGGIYPKLSWAQLNNAGATVKGQSQNAGPWQQAQLGVVNLVDEPRNTTEYRLGTPNFFAITHYNRSYFYASSVADLASELAKQMGYGNPN
ncbi:lytic murein transglycosylase B [Alcaligenes faecalis]|uniref:lytic murein transglycosylase B n=1 Tax=Alcaligenes faecalis TaxID=511 RepID=UPI000E163DC4|nr:lytic murein transglycosylase B [Alcaligenes faecalis]SSY69255.1 Membrane-bound lytic murein transglycosylase B precursor [Alcaligenes faecalis subsp. faecalis]